MRDDVIPAAEEGRIAIRNVRRDVMHDLRELKSEGEIGVNASLVKDDEETVQQVGMLVLMSFTTVPVSLLRRDLRFKVVAVMDATRARLPDSPSTRRCATEAECW